MQRKSKSVCAAVAAALVAASSTSAAEVYWQGGAGNLTDANYTDGVTPNLAPAAGDNLNLGGGGTVSNAVDATANAMRVGHSEATLAGAGTLNLTAGTLTLSGTSTILTSPNPAGTAIIGSGNTGILNVNGGSLTVSLSPMFVGYAAGGNGTLNLSAGTITLTNNRLGIGEGGNGSVIVSGGTLKTLGTGTGANGDMIVGVNGTSSFSQSGGTVSLQRDLIVGRRTADSSTFTMTGGSFTARDLSLADDGTPADATNTDSADNASFAVSGGSVALRGAFIGRNLASGTNFTISDDPAIAGGTTVTTTGEMQIGFNATTNTTATISGGDVTIGNNLLVADGTANGTTLNVSGGNISVGTADTSGGTFDLGRGGTKNTTFNFSGGTISVVAGVDTSNKVSEGVFNLANQTGATSVPAPVSVVSNHSGGTLNARGMIVGYNLGGSTTPGSNNATYNLSGTGVINASSFTIIGRRLQGTMNQTGGTANLAALSIGNNEGASTDPKVTGTYNISGGALNASSIALAPNASDSGTAGTGILNVLGDDATIAVTGNFSSTSSGTLAFGFETGDLLTLVNVGGTATFSNGAKVVLDATSAAPTATSYNLLTAADVTDSGIALTAPAGWAVDIIGGGNGEILRAVATAAPATLYWDTDGATGGSGGATPSGAWDGTAANFTADSGGASGSTLAITSSASDVRFAAGTDGTGDYAVTVTGRQVVKSLGVDRGNVTFTGGTIATSSVDVAAGATAIVNAAVATTTGLAKNGAGTLTLGAVNTYTGGTTVNAGTLKYGANDVVPSGSGKGNVVVTGTLDLNGFNGTVNRLTGAGTVTNSGGSPSTISVGGNNQTGTFSGTLSNTGATLALTKIGTGTLTLSGVNTHGGGTTLSAGALVLANADALGTGSLNVADGTLATAQAGLPKAVTVTTLTTNATGKVDITNNSMVIKGMTDSAVRTKLQAGYNAGAWNGTTGIVSTSITPAAATSIGYATQAQLGVTDFKGVTGLAATDVLVKFTYAGDANLDGKVDIGDLGLLAGAWQAASGKVWFDGDFTYDGAVDIGDLGLLSGNWQKGTAGNPNPPLMDFATAMAQFSAFDGVVVPEPVSLSLLALGGLALGRRRRRVQEN